MAAGGQKSKIGQILPHKSHFGSSFGSGSSDLDQIWQLDTTQPKEQAYGRILTYRKIQDGRRSRHYGKLRNRS